MKKDNKKKKLSNVGVAIITAIVVIIIFIILFLTTKYDVAFNTMGGASIPNQKINVFGQIKRPIDPTRDGYTFDNWYYDGGVFDFSTRITTNMILEARWIEGSPLIQYTVKFDTNGGNTIDDVKVNANGTMPKPANPTKEGYTFKSWQYNGKDFDFNTKINSNITLVATWTEGTTAQQPNTKPTNPSKPNGGGSTSKPGNNGGSGNSGNNGGTTEPVDPGTTEPEVPVKPTYTAVCEKVADSSTDQCRILIKSSLGGYVSGIVKVTTPAASGNMRTGTLIGTPLVRGLDVVSVD